MYIPKGKKERRGEVVEERDRERERKGGGRRGQIKRITYVHRLTAS